MTRSGTPRHLSQTAGLWIAAAAWAAATQFGEMLPAADCIGPRRLAIITFGAALVAMASAVWSGRAFVVAGDHRTRRFLGCVSAMVGAVLSFALLMQGLASLVLTGCER
jgi:hypothetical protein